jgi:sn-1 stearoyl-lipid 9-desaturase
MNPSLRSNTPRWPIAQMCVLILIHLGALALFVPGVFSWSGVGIAFCLYWVTGAWGVTLCFHRLLTHRSLRVWPFAEYLLAILGTLAFQGGPIEWVAIHRAHHAHSDRDGDPHDIRLGLSWAHLRWMMSPNASVPSVPEQHRLAADLYAKPFYRVLQHLHVPLQLGLAAILWHFGGLSWVILGICVRLVVTYHITWLVNSAAHHSGYRTFKTADNSTNNWFVGLLAWGEGWHNNHHAFPFSARHGLRWFELDITWLLIRLLAALRIAYDIKLPTREMIRRLQYSP